MDYNFENLCRRDEALSSHSSYATGGNARFFAEPETLEVLIQILQACRNSGVEFFIFGHGCNILFPDQPKQDKVFISLKRFADLKINESSVFFSAGIPLTFLALVGAMAGDSKFDFTFLLPGSVGAGIYINAKCFENQISQIVQTIYYLDLAADDFSVKSIKTEDCAFGYKTSIFQNKSWLIVGADFSVVNLDATVIKYMEGLLTRMKKENPNLSSLPDYYTFFEAEINKLPNIPPKFIKLMDYRNSKHHFEHPSCGSVFKNNYAFGIPMGKVIENLSLRGKQVGGAMVSFDHGNIIINKQDATSRDVIALIDLIKTEVNKAHGFMPEPEVIILKE